jgi:hypothetical protein
MNISRDVSGVKVCGAPEKWRGWLPLAAEESWTLERCVEAADKLSEAGVQPDIAEDVLRPLKMGSVRWGSKKKKLRFEHDFSTARPMEECEADAEW